MEKEIRFYNPKDVPFGPLSNDYVQYMRIDDKVWSSVTNYVLANLLNTPLYRNAIQASTTQGIPKKTNIEDKIKQVIANRERMKRAPLSQEEKNRVRAMVNQEVVMQKMDIYQKYYYYLDLERLEVVGKAVRDGYMAKVKENRALQEALAKTGDARIVYVSSNQQLGVDPEGKGLNLLGNALMQIRHLVRIELNKEKVEKERKEVEEVVYDTYVASAMVEKEVMKPADIRIYEGLSARQIIKQYLKNYPGTTLASLGIIEENKSAVLDMYEKGLLPLAKQELEKPGGIAKAVYEKNINQIRMKMVAMHNKIITEMYTEYVIKQNYPQLQDSQIKEASKQLQMSAPNMEQYTELVGKITSNYYKGNFPVDLIQEINLVLSKYPIPGYGEKEEKEEKDEEEEKIESSSSSSSSNELKNILKSDESGNKVLFAKQLSEFTGKSEKRYMKLSMEELQNKLKKYKSGEVVPEVKGFWRVTIKHRKGNKEIIDTAEGDRDAFVEKYNKEHPERQITKWQFRMEWVKGELESESEEENARLATPKELSPAPVLKSANGKPVLVDEQEVVKIYGAVEKNEGVFQQFSPLFVAPFIVNGDEYPSMSIYITTMLLTTTGKREDVRRKGVYSRGMSVAEARSLLRVRDGSFLVPDEANMVFKYTDKKSTLELTTIFANVAIKKKFINLDLQNLLLLTENAKLIYENPQDPILGTGPEGVGMNLTGNILQRIRAGINKARRGIKLPPLRLTMINKFILEDMFMENWAKMKLKEMCQTVSRAQQLASVKLEGPVEQTSEFAEVVLDTILQPCTSIGALTEEVKISVPKEFVELVKTSCTGMGTITRNYNEEIENVRKDMMKEEDKFFGKRTTLPEEDKKLEDDIRKEWQAVLDKPRGVPKPDKKYYDDASEELFFQKYPNPTEDQLKKLESAKEKLSIMIKQVDEENNRPENLLVQKRELLKELEDLRILHENRRIAYYGMAQRRSKEEKQAFEALMARYTDMIAQINRERKQELLYIEKGIQELAELYWKRITTMVYFLLKYRKESSEQDIRKIIAKIELMSYKQVKCKSEVMFEDDEENCIASALANILVGVQTMKNRQGLPLALEKEDIDFAVALLTDKKFQAGKKTTEEEEEEEEAVEEGPEYIEGEEEEEYGDEDEDIIGSLAEFGIGKTPSKNEQVKILLKQIGGEKIKDINTLADAFVSAVKTIKNEKGIPPNVKINRINFFATIA